MEHNPYVFVVTVSRDFNSVMSFSGLQFILQLKIIHCPSKVQLPVDLGDSDLVKGYRNLGGDGRNRWALEIVGNIRVWNRSILFYLGQSCIADHLMITYI